MTWGGEIAYRCSACRDRGCLNVYEWRERVLEWATAAWVAGRDHPPFLARELTAEWGRREWRLFALQQHPALVRCTCPAAEGKYVGMKRLADWMAPHVWAFGGEPWTPAAESWFRRLDAFEQPPVELTAATVPDTADLGAW